MEINIEL
jgi:hypothetical protein